MFALDVTNPKDFKESMAQKLVLWEFTDQDDPQMGRTLARPTVALLPNGRWAAIFGNGYAPFPKRNAGADRSKANCNFFQVFLESF